MRTMINLAMITCMALVFTGCVLTHATSSKGLEVPIEKATVKFPSDIKDGGYKIVGTDELIKWLDEGKN
jgi:PBP1b-binding outer membrane lipoprotein LpoB